MASIKLENVYKKYEGNEKYSIEDISMDISDGAFAVFLGPSGCGKSTTLRMIAGLEKINEGNIYIGDRLVNDVAPGDRKVAMVFQNYALYPTMTVRENIEFGLINNKVPKDERNRLIKEISEIVYLDEYMNRRPSNLSGGQRQRVALARAMVKKPDLFILDEPLSNLDAKLRVQMRSELKKIHKRLGTTFIYVTHDQVEAMSMGSQIIVMNDGKIMQDASSSEVYNDPSNIFTARFIGTPPMNIIEVNNNVKHIFNLEDDKIKHVGFRPEDAAIVDEINWENNVIIQANIESYELLGSEIIYTLKNALGELLIKTHDKEKIYENIINIAIPKKYVKYFDIDGNIIKETSIDTKKGNEDRKTDDKKSYTTTKKETIFK